MQSYIFFLIVFSVLLVVASILLRRWAHKKYLARSLQFGLLEAKLTESASYGEQRMHMQKFFAALADFSFERSFWEKIIAVRPYLGIEIAVVKNKARFFFLMPRGFRKEFTTLVRSTFPHAEIKNAEDYTIFTGEEKVLVKRAALAEDKLMPLDTASEAFLLRLFRIFERYGGDESLGFQMLFSPKSASWHREQGQSVEDMESKLAANSKGKEMDEDIQEKHDLVGRKREKVDLSCFSLNVRIIFNTDDKERIKKFDEDIHQLFDGFRCREPLDYLVVRDCDGKKGVFEYVFRNFNEQEAITLNSKEMAWMVQLF